MVSLTIPITIEQLFDLARQLSPQERRVLLDSLLAERFEATLSHADRDRRSPPELTDDEIQQEIDTVQAQRRQERDRAANYR